MAVAPIGAAHPASRPASTVRSAVTQARVVAWSTAASALATGPRPFSSPARTSMRERALTGSGRHLGEGERVGDGVGAAEPFETGGGEHHGVEVAVGDASETGVDVAADVDDLEVGTAGLQLRDTARRARADTRALGKGVEGEPVARAQRVTRVRPLGDRTDDETGSRRRSAGL